MRILAHVLLWIVTVVLELIVRAPVAAQDRAGQLGGDTTVVRSAGATEVAELGAGSEAVLREVRAFYRDLGTRQWNDLLNHFWPAKLAARWPPPVVDPRWRAMGEPVREASGNRPLEYEGVGTCGSSGQARTVRPAVVLVGKWARVAIESCSAAAGGLSALDELWLLEVGGDWKIVYLSSGRSAGAGVAPAGHLPGAESASRTRPR